MLKPISAQTILNFTVCCLTVLIVSNAQFIPDSAEEKHSFTNYGNKLIQKYRKDYLSAIFENSTVREDFTRFVNSRLTPEVKSDLKAVRIFKKVGGIEMPVINFSAHMDSFLGILPQWKRLKMFYFNQMEAYVDLHPDILYNARPATTTAPLFFKRRIVPSSIK